MKIIVAFQKDFDDDIEFYWKWAADFIKWGTKSAYFHVEIAIDEKWVGAHTDQGIEIHDLKPLYSPQFDYYELDIPELTETQNKIFWQFVERQNGTGYDWIGIYLTQFIMLDWESKSKWFCSEIVVKLLQLLYVEEFLGMKPNRISPQQVFEVIKMKGTKLEIEN